MNVNRGIRLEKQINTLCFPFLKSRYRYLIYLLILFYSSPLLAQNVLHLFSSKGQAFQLVIDSQLINKQAQAHVKSQVLKKDTVTVTLLFTDKTKHQAQLFLLVKRKPVQNKEFTYAIEPYKFGYRMKYIGYNTLKKLPEPLVPPQPVADTSWKVNNTIWDRYCELKAGKVFYFNNLSQTKTPMPQVYVDYALRLLKRYQTPDEKWMVLEQTVLKNYLSSFQLKTLVQTTPYELDKLKLVRLAYPHITDATNLKNLSDLFTYESSKRELASLLKQPPAPSGTIMKDCAIASENTAIETFVKQLKTLSSDQERLTLLTENNALFCYNTEQAKWVLNTFIHDRERLDAAKKLYYASTNRETFIDVKTIFIYPEMQTELKRFLEQFEK